MGPRYSVVIPTLNEAAQIETTIASARAAFGNVGEVIVADGGSSDATCALAEKLGAIVLRTARGRGRQLQAGVKAAQGEILVLLHADTSLPAGAATAIDAALADEDNVGGAFRLRFVRDGTELPFPLRALEPAINFRSRVFQTATGDQAIFARRAAVNAVGGVPAVPLFEDIRLYGALRRAGRMVLLREVVTTSPRLWLMGGPVRVILLHLAFRAMHALGVSPNRLARWYPSVSRR